MKKIHIVFLYLSLLLCSVNTYAQFRKYSNEFLNIGAGARGLAMGGAQVASVNNATAAYWNPAGLSNVIDQPTINFMHAEYFAGIGKYDYGTIAFPSSGNKRTIGLSLLRFAVDDIPNTLYLVEPDGSINYNNIQTFSSADYAFLLSVAQEFKDFKGMKVSGGLNAKVINRKVGSFAKAWGFGFDVGIQLKAKKWFAGISARDITTTFNAWSFTFTEKEKEALYLTNNDIPVKSTELTAPRLILAGGYKFTVNENIDILAEMDLDLIFDGKRNTVISSNVINVDPHIGVEAGYKNTFFVRAGINNFQRALKDADTLNQKKVWIYQPSLGAGIKINNVMIDYAFTNLANQSNPLYTHVFSLQFGLGRKEKK